MMKTTKESNNTNASMDDHTMLASVYLANGFVKTESVYRLRIHEMMWCEIDCFGFADIIRKREFSKVWRTDDKVTLPTPIRTQKQFESLMSLLNGG